ncbi:MAG: TadE family protein [Sneathiella sp.]
MTRKAIRKGANLHDERGSLAVELAILLPLVFALIFGVIDVSRVLLARGLVDQLGVELSNGMKFETTPAMRSVMTEAALQARLSGLAPEMAGGLLDVSRLELSVIPYENLLALVSNTAADGGGLIAWPEEVVAIRLDYAVPLITPFASLVYEAGDVTQSSIVVVKNGR